MTIADPKSSGACGARKKGGGTCELPLGWGTEHLGEGRCKFHGGASPQAQLAGVVTLARRDAAVMGRPLEIEPHEAILECIRIAAGEVAYCSEKVALLSERDVMRPVVTSKRRALLVDEDGDPVDSFDLVSGRADGSERVSAGDEVKTGAPALNAWVLARQDAMERLVKFSAVALKAGVQERQVRVAEQQGEAFVGFVRRLLVRLGLQDDPAALEAVRAELQIGAGVVDGTAAAS